VRPSTIEWTVALVAHIIQTIRGVSTSTRTWHTLTGTIAGKQLTVELDGKERLQAHARPRAHGALRALVESRLQGPLRRLRSTPMSVSRMAGEVGCHAAGGLRS